MASRAARDFPNLTVLSHPLIQHKLTILRDKQTSTRDFKQLVNEIAMLMAYEVTKDLPLEAVEIETPLEKTTGSQVAGKKLTLVPILRAGLGMVEGISQLIPSARVGHIAGDRRVRSRCRERPGSCRRPGATDSVPVPRVRSRGREGDAGRPPQGARLHRFPRSGAELKRVYPAGSWRCWRPPLWHQVGPFHVTLLSSPVSHQ